MSDSLRSKHMLSLRPVVFSALLLTFTKSLVAQTYWITDLGSPPMAQAYFKPTGVNNLGEVALYGSNRSYIWTGGRLFDIGPGYTYGISDRSEVLFGGGNKAGIWRNGVVTPLP